MRKLPFDKLFIYIILKYKLTLSDLCIYTVFSLLNLNNKKEIYTFINTINK